MLRKLATAAALAALTLFTRAPLAGAQKALVYCPVGVDATGCDRIVGALSAKFTEGVDRGYDGSAGTIDLEKADLHHYSVFVVPSLADDGDKQPYAVLRKAASHLHYAINGRVAVYSGAPDQGNSNRADKDALIQNLTSWASDGHTRKTGLVGMVAFLDLSEDESARYSWVHQVSLVDVSADTEDQSIGEATPVGTRGGDLLKVGGRALNFSNMASNGLHIGNRGAARAEIGAIGGTTSHQSILVTYSNADGAGDKATKVGTSGGASYNLSAGKASLDVAGSANATSGATLTTDKPDYLPGDTVTFTGTGFAAGDTVTITVHEDPTWSYPDRQFRSVADGNGGFVNRQMVVDQQDLGATFTATGVGNPSGTVAQVTFTDGSVDGGSILTKTVNAGPPQDCSNTQSTTFTAGSSVCADVTIHVGGNGTGGDYRLQWYLGANTSPTRDILFSNVSSGSIAQDIFAPAAGSWTIKICKTTNAGACSSGNVAGTTTFSVTGNTAPVAANDSYGTNEDNPLTVGTPGVLANDTDADGNTITAVLVSGPSHGTLTLNANGSFTYTPSANYSGSDSFTYNANDGTTNSTSAATVSITVTAVNDAPTFTLIPSHTALEDAGAQTVTNALSSSSRGPADENAQTLSLTVSNDNAGLFSAQPSIDLVTGNLAYTPAANASGAATVTVKLKDNGGTANGGVDETTKTLTITVTPVNDAPSFAKGANQTVNEDAGAQSVAGWATAISAGPNESSQTVDFVVGADNTTLFSVQPAVSASGTLTYTPAANAFGTATVTIHAHDDGGVANGGVDISGDQTFTITINPVNDAPSFVKGADQTILEDAAAQTVSGWATAISVGPANEAGQVVDFVVNNNATALFSVQPAISAAGALSYTPATNANGTATVTVHIHDNGGTANGGVDASVDQTFTITIKPLNDAPSFAKGADQTVNEDAGAQSVTGWATGISAGPANESSQTVSFSVTGNTNAALFSVAPAIASNGTLTYTPAADANGTATITIAAQDNGGTADGGVDASAPQTFIITVNPVNDAPAFSLIASHTVLEDAGAQSVPNALTGKSAGPANEASQTLALTVSNNNAALFSAAPSIDPSTGTLTYTPAANANGSAIVTVKLKDDGGTANGGVDETTHTLTIYVTAVNDAPSFTKGGNQTSLEDAGGQSVSWATAVSAGPADESGQALNFIVDNNNHALFSVQPAVSATGQLTYTAAPNANGSAIVTVKLHDDGGVANGGVDTSPEETFTITITAVNDAPSFTKGANQTVLEDASAQTVNGWATTISAGPTDEASQTVAFHATNTNNALFSSQPAIDASGNLTYTPAADAYGTATVTVALQDNGGTANGGVDTSAPQTFTITITPVNDAPSFTKGADQTVNEDAGAQSISGWATAISAGPNEAAQHVDFVVSNSNNALFIAQPTVSPAGTLSYTPAPDAFGTATVTLHIHDDGGTDNGGVDHSGDQTFTITVNSVNDAPSFTKGANQTVLEDAAAQTVAGWATGISAGPANESAQSVSFVATNNNMSLFSVQPTVAPNGTLAFTPAPDAFGVATVTIHAHDDGGTANGGVDVSANQYFTITIKPVNDAPSFTKGADQTKLEDAGAQTIPGWATNVSKGPANESGQSLTFIVTNTNNALFSAQPAIDASGQLVFTSAPNANGSATVTVKLMDDGGTDDGGVDTSAPQTFTITITPVNDAPSFAKGADQTKLEDAGAQSVTGWATAISAGPTDESSQVVSFLVTNNNNALFSVQPAIDGTGKLTYTLAANANGVATVTVKAKDDGGTLNGGMDTSAPQYFTITVTPVNDAPSFTKGADQTKLEDAGGQTVAGWATAISAGPPDESSQTLTFQVTGNTNPALFSVAPAVSAAGDLTFTSAPNANGTATITIKLMDNGGTANDGSDTSPEQTFVITVTPVNDAPSFTKGVDQTVLEDAGAQTVNGWATAISAGPADESAQTLNFFVSNDNNSLFSVQPALDASGKLTYTPAPDANGSATVTVYLKDNGGTANGGIDASATQTFTISVTPVNDAPSFTKGADQTKLEDAGPQSVVAWATSVSKGPANESAQTLTFTVTNDNNSLFSAQPAIDASGKLTYTPAPNANGVANVTVVLKDDGGTTNGGSDTAPTQTFVITITPVNDAPTFDVVAPPSVLEDAGPQSVSGVVSNRSPGPSNESSQQLTLTVTSTNAALFTAAPAIDASGTLTYTPAPNANGTSTVTLVLKDNGGTASGGVDATMKMFTITVTPVNDAPHITSFSSAVAPTPVNTSVSAAGVFSDVDLGDASPDTHTGTIDWGDGTTSATTIASGTGITRNFSGSHTYTDPGVYTVTAKINDAASASDTWIYQYVVVYDPSAGFVTGGGWINSPAGAYSADLTLTGKANFGFTAKYQKGANVPTGNTEFQFQEGNLNFKSTDFQWLVIQGTTKSQFKGTGTINGRGRYNFLVTAVDGDNYNGVRKPDSFRIKITDFVTGAVVYDNQMGAADTDTDSTTALGGGSIVIHDK